MNTNNPLCVLSSPITPQALSELLANWQNLRAIKFGQVNDTPWVTDEHLQFVKNVETLNLGDIRNISEEGLKVARQLNPGLKGLVAVYADDKLLNLAEPSIRTLLLTKAHLSSDGWARLGILPDLSTLWLNDSSVTTEDLSQTLAHLKRLSLGKNHYRDGYDGIINIIFDKGKDLIELTLEHFNDPEFFTEKSLPYLKWLKLNQCYFSPSFLAKLLDATPNIVRLNLHGFSLMNAARWNTLPQAELLDNLSIHLTKFNEVENFQENPYLKTLEIKKCEIANSDILKIVNQTPNLAVLGVDHDRLMALTPLVKSIKPQVEILPV
jgi:hypothetical protein